MGKEKPISDLMKGIIGFSLNVAENQIQKRIDDPTIEQGVQKVFPLLREIVDELNDDNPNNAAQVKESVMAWTNGPLADYLAIILQEIEDKLDDEDEKVLVAFVGRTMITILKMVTDLEKDNVAQIRGLWQSEEFQEDFREILLNNLLLPILERKNVSEEIRNLVYTIINVIVETLTKKQ